MTDDAKEIEMLKTQVRQLTEEKAALEFRLEAIKDFSEGTIRRLRVFYDDTVTAAQLANAQRKG